MIPQSGNERMTNSEIRKDSSSCRHFYRSALGLLSLFVISHSSFTLTGCVTKATAKAQAQTAFLAGQNQAMMRMQQQQLQQARGATVSFVGPLTNPNIPWTTDLTLARAIDQAGYTGTAEPSRIFIVRNGQAIQVDTKQLLAGQDQPLMPGDVIQIMQ
jgi:hypothetical protein